MRCHAEYGHVGKKILGGISVTFTADPLIETRKSSVAQTHIAFTLIFLVGFVGICSCTYLVLKKREEAEKANQKVEEGLESIEDLVMTVGMFVSPRARRQLSPTNS